ncbi:MAG TPA: response regulator [Planctomycetes bacterium]|nr:response regulator [Fuerstiella sp.]HIK93467.1 response regulator [Planctomycetota bacterium]
MSKILVVDDSAFDRRLAISILEKSPELIVAEAGDGQEALRMLADQSFDLVLTDLNMPVMSGLELIQKLQKTHSDLPSIVMTAYGSEATAMYALQAGAYGYVPKHHLQEELAAVVAHVLSTTTRQKQEDEFLGSIEKHAITLKLPNERQRIVPTIAFLHRLMDAMGLLKGPKASHLGIALAEALCNAMVHGNLEVSSELRALDDHSWGDQIEQRSRTAPYANRRVTVDVRLDSNVAVFTIRDEGPGFDVSSIPDPRNPENMLRPSGRGLTLMHAFLDEVTHNEKGNEVTLRMNVSQEETPTDTQVAADSEVLTPEDVLV